jgi:hypothetical protein
MRWVAILVLFSFGCGSSHDACRFNSDCAAGRYCDDGVCRADCTTDAECVQMLGGPASCSSFGECVALDAGMLDAGMPDAGRDAMPPIDAGPSCENERLDGDETDVDCGGSCEPCAPGARCVADDDCSLGRCAAGSCAGACSVRGLAAYYPLDGDTLDRSGHRRDLAAVGTTSTSGAFDRALSFDGMRSSLRATGSGRLSGARTLCAWVRPTARTGLAQPLFTGGASTRGDFFAIQSSTPMAGCSSATAGQPVVDHWGSPCIVPASVSVPAEGPFTFVCYSFDGDRMHRFVVDGMTREVVGALFDYDFDTLTIGSSTIGGTTTQPFYAGAIDEVSIWDRALDAEELSAIYDEGRGCVPCPAGCPAGLACDGVSCVADAAADFSPTTNPSGGWTYGWSPTRDGAFTPLDGRWLLIDELETWGRSSDPTSSRGNPGVSRNRSGRALVFTDTTWPARALSMHPGPSGERPVLRWTAAVAGSYRVRVVFRGAVTVGATTTDVAVRIAGTERFSAILNQGDSGNEASFEMVVPLEAGAHVDASVGWGANGTYISDTTLVEARITPAD